MTVGLEIGLGAEASWFLVETASPFARAKPLWLDPLFDVAPASDGRPAAGSSLISGAVGVLSLSSGGGPIGGRAGLPKRDGSQAGRRMQNRTSDATMSEKPRSAMAGAMIMISGVAESCER